MATATANNDPSAAGGRVGDAGAKPHRGWSVLCAVGLCFLLSFGMWTSKAQAQATGQLEVRPGPDLSGLQDRPLDAVEVRFRGNIWSENVQLQSVRPGDLVSGERTDAACPS
jgi:hypothetical protein